jgi:1,2-diacylglycerol 3-alpha-glucosyltransferase
MRIAQFTESYRPVINGVAVAVDLLADEFRKRHHVEVFAPSFPGYLDPAPVHRFPSYFAPGHRDYPLAIPFSPSLYRRFKQAGFHIVHTHSPFALGQTGRRWARRLGLPVVTTYHTLYETYTHYARYLPPSIVRALLKDLSRRYCDACDAVVVPTEPVRDVLLGYGVRRSIHVIPTGLKLTPPPPRDPEFPRRALGIPPDAPLVLYAGRLAQEKNLDLLFGAFARAARRLPEAWLLIAGSGPEEAEARRLAGETGAAARIVFAGFVPPDRMPLLYAGADVFAFSSATDTQGLVLTEAKAAGLPVVSVCAYGPSVVVTDGVDGFLVPDDAEAFAAALARLLEDPSLRRSMGEAALREAKRFSIEASAAAYEQVFEALLGAKGTEPQRHGDTE